MALISFKDIVAAFCEDAGCKDVDQMTVPVFFL